MKGILRGWKEGIIIIIIIIIPVSTMAQKQGRNRTQYTRKAWKKGSEGGKKYYIITSLLQRHTTSTSHIKSYDLPFPHTTNEVATVHSFLHSILHKQSVPLPIHPSVDPDVIHHMCNLTRSFSLANRAPLLILPSSTSTASAALSATGKYQYQHRSCLSVFPISFARDVSKGEKKGKEHLRRSCCIHS